MPASDGVVSGPDEQRFRADAELCGEASAHPADSGRVDVGVEHKFPARAV